MIGAMREVSSWLGTEAGAALNFVDAGKLLGHQTRIWSSTSAQTVDRFGNHVRTPSTIVSLRHEEGTHVWPQ